MKFYTRLLLTVPFMLTAYWYYQFADPDNTCGGLVHNLFSFIIVFIFIITGALALAGAFRLRKPNQLAFDPVCMLLILLCFASLIYTKTFRGHRTGKLYVYARQLKTGIEQFDYFDLSLRTNNTYTFGKHTIETSCYQSGQFETKGDTLIFDKPLFKKVNGEYDTMLIMDSARIMPIHGHNIDWVLDIIKQ